MKAALPCSPAMGIADIDSNVLFKCHCSYFLCTKSLFGDASAVFKQVFEACDHKDTSRRFRGVAVKLPSATDSLTVVLEENPEVFEAVHAFLHNPRLVSSFRFINNSMFTS